LAYKKENYPLKKKDILRGKKDILRGKKDILRGKSHFLRGYPNPQPKTGSGFQNFKESQYIINR